MHKVMPCFSAPTDVRGNTCSAAPISVVRILSALSTSDMSGYELRFPGTCCRIPHCAIIPVGQGSDCLPFHPELTTRSPLASPVNKALPMVSIGIRPSTPRPPVEMAGPRCVTGVNIAGSPSSLIGVSFSLQPITLFRLTPHLSRARTLCRPKSHHVLDLSLTSRSRL